MSQHERAERVAKRVRAALAYAGLTYEDAAEKIPDLGAATLRRIALMTNPRSATLHELGQIALACEVPLQWLTGGRWVEDERSTTPFPELRVGSRERRLAVVEHYLEQLLLLELGDTFPFRPPPPDVDVETKQLDAPRRRARSSA